jgi:hypothetical protein
MIVRLYRQVGKGKNRPPVRKSTSEPGRRPADLAGPYFLRFSLEDGTRPWVPVGADFDAAVRRPVRGSKRSRVAERSWRPASETRAFRRGSRRVRDSSIHYPQHTRTSATPTASRNLRCRATKEWWVVGLSAIDVTRESTRQT